MGKTRKEKTCIKTKEKNDMSKINYEIKGKETTVTETKTEKVIMLVRIRNCSHGDNGKTWSVALHGKIPPPYPIPGRLCA